LGEIAVFGGTAHSALSAETRADLGVRCAAKPGQQRHCLAVLPRPGAISVMARWVTRKNPVRFTTTTRA
jgi:hypothetical protein